MTSLKPCWKVRFNKKSAKFAKNRKKGPTSSFWSILGYFEAQDALSKQFDIRNMLKRIINFFIDLFFSCKQPKKGKKVKNRHDIPFFRRFFTQYMSDNHNFYF